jgi:hypothetical protein
MFASEVDKKTTFVAINSCPLPFGKNVKININKLCKKLGFK